MTVFMIGGCAVLGRRRTQPRPRRVTREEVGCDGMFGLTREEVGWSECARVPHREEVALRPWSDAQPLSGRTNKAVRFAGCSTKGGQCCARIPICRRRLPLRLA